jgi:prepilin-type N-terminal cleavage/methylation domain-containing protein
MRKKGFTLIELLIVIAIIALLMSILVPAVQRARIYAYRMLCGSNLSGIGKAIQLYAGDFSEEYPYANTTKRGGLCQAGLIMNFSDTGNVMPTSDATKSIYKNEDGSNNSNRGYATMGCLYYLLVKFEDVSVKQFNCHGDSGVTPFKLTDPQNATLPSINDYLKAWDFGRSPGKYNSYSYHNPYSWSGAEGFGITSNSPPASPLAADRNPALDRNAMLYIKGGTIEGGSSVEKDSDGNPIPTPRQRWDTAGGTINMGEYSDPTGMYNSASHQREGQNVLFNDGSVKFESKANVGIDNDNIWQRVAVPPDAPTEIPPRKRTREVGGYFPYMPGSAGTKSNFASPMSAIYPAMVGDALLVSEHQDCKPQGY